MSIFCNCLTKIDSGSSEGKLSADDVSAIIEGKDRTKAGPTAEAQGLMMLNIIYE